MSGVSNKEEKSDEYSQDMTQAMGAGTFFCVFVYMILPCKPLMTLVDDV